MLLLLVTLVAVGGRPAAAQGTGQGRVVVRVMAEEGALPGAEVRGGGKVAITDTTGRAELELAPGGYRVTVWRLGYSVDTLAVSVRADRTTSVTARLETVAQELAPIVVRATRGETRLEEEPERVEVLAPEDVQEKSFTNPGSLTNLLVEMGGVRVERVAPALGGASVRIQGLPGQYTLLLEDGLPLYGAHAPAFSLVQAPPLDLRQVEVLKGATSALYGPDALGGVVDLITKTPDDTRQLVLSQDSRSATDGLLWLSRRLSAQWGYTLLGGAHRRDRQDIDGDGWADLAGFRRGEIRPRLFWNGRDGSSALLTVGGTWEDRTGGTLHGGTVPFGVPFPVRLDTRHLDAGLSARKVLAPGLALEARGAAMGTSRHRTFGSQRERDRLGTWLAETMLGVTRGRHDAVAGLAAAGTLLRTTPRADLDHDYTTVSAFASETYTPAAALALAVSARLDDHSRYGTFLSPRASVLYRLGDEWSVRASLARGFHAPDVIIGETEDVGFSRLVLPTPLAAERGESVSLDVQGRLGPVQLTTTLFGVRVHRPVLAVPLATDSIRFALVNAPGPIRSAGVEVFGVYAREPFLVTATYSHTRATERRPGAEGREAVPLTPLNAGGIDVAWEEDEPGEAGFRAAVELFYTGHQRVEEDPYRERTPGYTTVDVLLSKRFGAVTAFMSGEDLTNVRQTRWDPLLRPTPGPGGRWTTAEWAPLEGRAVSVGIRAGF